MGFKSELKMILIVVSYIVKETSLHPPTCQSDTFLIPFKGYFFPEERFAAQHNMNV